MLSPASARSAAAAATSAEGVGRLAMQPQLMQQMMAMFASMQRTGSLQRVAGMRPVRMPGYVRGGASGMRGGSFVGSGRGGGVHKFAAHGGGADDLEDEAGMEGLGEEAAEGGYYGYEDGPVASRRSYAGSSGYEGGGSWSGTGLRGGMRGSWVAGRGGALRGRVGPGGGRFGAVDFSGGGGRGTAGAYLRGEGGYMGREAVAGGPRARWCDTALGMRCARVLTRLGVMWAATKCCTSDAFLLHAWCASLGSHVGWLLAACPCLPVAQVAMAHLALLPHCVTTGGP